MMEQLLAENRREVAEPWLRKFWYFALMLRGGGGDGG